MSLKGSVIKKVIFDVFWSFECRMKFRRFHRSQNLKFNLWELSVSFFEFFWRFKVLNCEILIFKWLWSIFRIQMLESKFREFHWIWERLGFESNLMVESTLIGLRKIILTNISSTIVKYNHFSYHYFLHLGNCVLY